MKKSIILIALLLCSATCLAQTNAASVYIDYANKRLEEKDYEGAMKTLNLAIKEMPDSVALYDMRGVLLEAFQLYNEAIRDFTLGVEKATDNKTKSHLLANRGGTKFRIRDFRGSYSDLVEAIALDSTNIDALNNLAAVCDEVGKPEEALRYLKIIIKTAPKYAPAYVNLGFKYQAVDEHQKAIEYFDKAIALNPDEALGYSNRSFSKLKTNDLEGAMKDIKHAIKLFPSNSYAYKIRALILIEKNKLEDACEDLTTASELGYSEQYGNEVNDLKEKYCK